MIVIAPDKFKGTLSAAQAADAIAGGLRDAGIADTLRLYPMADGGDGTAAVLAGLLPGGTCMVETHQHIGPACFRCEPAARSSFALGVEIGRALERGGRVLVGIGGTACCDGGAGMLQALGLRAFRADGSEITEPLSPATLMQVASVDASALPRGARIIALSDVRASLAPSPDSALSALDFAHQKGFAETYMPQLAGALRHWHDIAAPGRSSPVDGAGGGVGFALVSVLGAEARSGARFVADAYGMPVA
ncbi:MAG: glycerate kinase, partial [Muribaculaceae bacterium]|nr:glycerate kinase [Muribaculaceae bacterium]